MQAWESKSGQTAHCTKASGWKVKLTVKVDSFTPTETFTRASGKTTKHTERECTDILTEQFIKAIGTKTNSTAKEKRLGLTNLNTMEIS